MIDKDQDIFGKIDAMLERSDADFLTEKNTASDDFPVLTEVIEEVRSAVCEEPDETNSNLQVERRLADRRVGQRRQSSPTDQAASVPENEVERLLAEMEQRLTALFIGQQSQLDEVLRKAVRDALAGSEGSQS
jgi:hypothetical protein